MVEIPRTPSEQIDLSETLKVILKNAISALGGSGGAIATWNEGESRFVIDTYLGMDEPTVSQLQPLLKEAAPDLAGSKNSFSTLSELQPGLPLPLSNKGIQQNSIIALPLQIAGKWMGLIYILRPIDSVSFATIDQPVLAAFAEQAAIAVQNARLAYRLAEEKQRVDYILEHSPESLFSLDSERRIISLNTPMEQLSGYTREELIGKYCAQILDFRNAEGTSLCRTKCPLLSNDIEDKSNIELHGKIQTRNGRPLDVAMNYSIIRTSRGEAINAVVSVRDISDLLELENIRETFLSIIGHELQTPLSIIKGYASMMSEYNGKMKTETVRQNAAIIKEESDRLSRIVNKLLFASRISAGTISLEKEPLQLFTLVGKVARRYQTLTDIHELIVNAETCLPYIRADAALIEETLNNLVENAIKYSPDGGIIDISVKSKDKWIVLSVTDKGVGIHRSELDAIFQRFGRGTSRLVQRTKGTGLGLYICKFIVEAHCGQIDVSSIPGEGSTFTISLPAE